MDISQQSPKDLESLISTIDRAIANAPKIAKEPQPNKDLSVNNIYFPPDLPEGDDGGGQVAQGQVGALQLLVAHQQLAKPVEPAVGRLHHPPPRPF